MREWEGRSLLRVSIAPYNEAADVERLLDALAGSGALQRLKGDLTAGSGYGTLAAM